MSGSMEGLNSSAINNTPRCSNGFPANGHMGDTKSVGSLDHLQVLRLLNRIPRTFDHTTINIRTATRAHAVEALTNGYTTMLSLIKLMAAIFGYGQPHASTDLLDSNEDVSLDINNCLLPIHLAMQPWAYLAFDDAVGSQDQIIVPDAPAEKLPPSLQHAIHIILEIQKIVELLHEGQAFEPRHSSLWIEGARPGPNEYQDQFQENVRDLVDLMDGNEERVIVGWVQQLEEQEIEDGIKYWWGRSHTLDSN